MQTRLVIMAAFAAFVTMASEAQAQEQKGQAQGASQSTKEREKDPIDAERPGFTNGTGTVPPGHVQFEAGYLYTTQTNGIEHRIGDSALVRVPTGANTEVRFGLPTYFFTHFPKVYAATGGSGNSDNTRGFGDASISAKWRFLDALTLHSRPSLAFIAQTTLPTGEPAYRETHLQPQIALEASYDLSTSWNVQSNFIYARPADSGQLFTQYSGGINVSHNLTETVTAFLETYRIAPTGASAPNGNYFDGGITYTMKNNTQFDFNLGKGISSSLSNDSFIGVGIAHRW